jgi:clan AA aspartic protease
MPHQRPSFSDAAKVVRPANVVRAKVRLRNAGDEMLRRRRKLSAGEVRQLETEAVVDTGAVRTIVPAKVVKQLGLRLRSRRVAEYADGRKQRVGVTEPFLVDLGGEDTVEEALVLGNEVLVGQTVLEKLDMLVDCANNRVIPNPAHPAGPVTKVR